MLNLLRLEEASIDKKQEIKGNERYGFKVG
jgi:hypothetical protein